MITNLTTLSVRRLVFSSKHLLNSDIFNLNYSVEVVNGVVYLIGIAQNKEELDQVIKISENTYGTKNVISYVRLKEKEI